MLKSDRDFFKNSKDRTEPKRIHESSFYNYHENNKLTQLSDRLDFHSVVSSKKNIDFMQLSDLSAGPIPGFAVIRLNWSSLERSQPFDEIEPFIGTAKLAHRKRIKSNTENAHESSSLDKVHSAQNYANSLTSISESTPGAAQVKRARPSIVHTSFRSHF